MLIAIDIDDVLAEFIEGFIQFHNRMYGTSLIKKNMITYSFWDILNETKEEGVKRLYNFFNSSDFREIPPNKDALDILNILKKNHKLVVITSRPNTFEKKTREWINHHFPGIFSEIYFLYNEDIREKRNKTKGEICEKLKVDVFIEDSLVYAEGCANKGIKVLLLDCPWNQSEELPENVVRIKDWNEVLNHTLKST